MKKLPSMTWLLLAIAACCPLLTGCWGSEDSSGPGITNAEESEVYQERDPLTNKKAVDSETSWRNFFSKFKGVLKKPDLAVEAWKSQYSAGKISLELMLTDPQMEYIQFGSESEIKGVNSDRVYEVGVIPITASEDKGSEGFEEREYKLKFITPKQDGEWKYAEGFFKISSSRGNATFAENIWYPLKQEEFEKSYLKLLFFEPPAKEDEAKK